MSDTSKSYVDSTGVFFPRMGEPAPPPSLERALLKEIHKTDLLRTRLLAVVLSVFLVGFIILRLTVMEGMGIGQSIAIVSSLGTIIALELFTARQIRKSMAEGGERVPLFARYSLAAVEITVISIVQLSGALTEGAEYLVGPGAWVYFFFIVASTLYLEFPLAFFTGAIAAVQWAAISWMAIERAKAGPDFALIEAELPSLYRFVAAIAKAVILLLCGGAAGIVGWVVRNAARTALEKHERMKSVRAMFGQFVSPDVATQLLAGGGKGETREVCVMFVDIRNFTAFSESRTPAEVVAYLNGLFDELVTVVGRHGGCVSKFLGDGFMAVFGAPLVDPDASLHAIECAREMLAKLEELNARKVIPETRIGIGLHAGSVVAGEVGSQERKEYTVIGDTVNLAARIEALNKEFGSTLLVSGEVLTAAGITPEGSIDRGPMQVKGRTSAVRVVQLA